MTLLECTIATELENRGLRAIADDGRVNYGIASVIESYVSLVSKCHENTPTAQNKNLHGYNIIKLTSVQEKMDTTKKLIDLWTWGIADGKNTVNSGVSSPNNTYNSFTLTEKGIKLFEDHKEKVSKDYNSSKQIS